MKIKHTRNASHGAILLAAMLTTGAASAATTSDKDGMDTTTIVQTDRNYDREGLPMLAPGVQELSLGGRLNWEDSTAYNFDID